MAGQNASMSDGLKKMIGELGQLMVANDADPQFLQAMQMTFTQYLQQKAGQAAQGQGGPGQGVGAGQQPGGQPGQAPAPPDQGGGAAGPPTGSPAGPLGPGSNPGMMGLSSAPAVDELSRMLGGGMT